LDQTQLRIEEAETQIVSNVENEIRNIDEFQTRALSMEENLQLASDLSASSLALYGEGTVTILDVLQSFRRETDTAENLLDAYLGWRRALLRIQRLTYFDFELGIPVLDHFGISQYSADDTD
jgi:outer membrane protein TolC